LDARSERGHADDLHTRFDQLITHEWGVFVRVVKGKPNKVIAHKIGVAERTLPRAIDEEARRALLGGTRGARRAAAQAWAPHLRHDDSGLLLAVQVLHELAALEDPHIIGSQLEPLAAAALMREPLVPARLDAIGIISGRV
jgi:hypothetical protein